MKKLLILSVLALLGATVQAQIPTLDISSLQQLYQQYQTMQEQLKKAEQIKEVSNDIFNQTKSIYQNAIGDYTKVTGMIDNWVGNFTTLRNQDWFGGDAFPAMNFANNVDYWANQVGGGYAEIGSMEQKWQTSLSRLNSGVATDWERSMAIAGYNSHVIDNARTSRDYGSNVVTSSKNIVQDVKQGTLIQQAGAQNALLYQQTALLDKMKNDINDSTAAEAAIREAETKAKAEREAQVNTIRGAGAL